MAMTRWLLPVGTVGVLLLLGPGWSAEQPVTAPRVAPSEGQTSDTPWMREIEQVFPRSENCRQCHDRQDGEWTMGRERAIRSNAPPRVDLTFPHGTVIASPLFRHVFGLWLQTQPTGEQQTRCLSCHVPSVTAFPQHTDKIARQVLNGAVTVEGISCAACHAIDRVHAANGTPPHLHPDTGQDLLWTVPVAGGESGAPDAAIGSLPGHPLLRRLSFRQGQGCHQAGPAR